MKITNMHIVKWLRMGMEFGYPPCCIGDFILNAVSGAYATIPRRKLHGTGYVPCAKCDKQTEDELIAIINSNRSAHLSRFKKYKKGHSRLFFE